MYRVYNIYILCGCYLSIKKLETIKILNNITVNFNLKQNFPFYFDKLACN